MMHSQDVSTYMMLAKHTNFDKLLFLYHNSQLEVSARQRIYAAGVFEFALSRLVERIRVQVEIGNVRGTEREIRRFTEIGYKRLCGGSGSGGGGGGKGRRAPYGNVSPKRQQLLAKLDLAPYSVNTLLQEMIAHPTDTDRPAAHQYMMLMARFGLWCCRYNEASPVYNCWLHICQHIIGRTYAANLRACVHCTGEYPQPCMYNEFECIPCADLSASSGGRRVSSFRELAAAYDVGRLATLMHVTLKLSPSGPARAGSNPGRTVRGAARPWPRESQCRGAISRI